MSYHDNFNGPCACGAWHTPDDFYLREKQYVPSKGRDGPNLDNRGLRPPLRDLERQSLFTFVWIDGAPLVVCARCFWPYDEGGNLKQFTEEHAPGRCPR